MLKILQNLTPLSLFFLLLYFAGLSVHVILQPFSVSSFYTTPAAELVFNEWAGFQNMTPIILRIIVLSSVFVQGLLVCYLLQSFKITSGFSLIPAAVYYLFCFLFNMAEAYHPLILINFLFIILIALLLNMYNKVKIDTAFFNAGLLLTLITLLFFPAAVVIIFCLYAFGKLRSTVFREILVFFSACIVIFFLVATAFFWFDSLPLFVHQFPIPRNFTALQIPPDIILIVKLFLLSVLLIVSFVFLNTKYSSVLIQIRKYFSCFIAYGFIIVLAACVATPFALQNFYPLLLPVSVIAGYFFMNLKNREAAEIVHLALLGIVLLFQYINFAE